MNRYGRLLRYALKQWPALLLILGLSVAASAAIALQPWPLKILVDYALGGVELSRALRTTLMGFALSATAEVLIVLAALASLGFVALNSALEVGLTMAWAAAGQRMIYDLAADLFRRLQRLSLLFHNRRTVGDALNRLSGDSWCVYSVTEGLLVSPARHAITLLTVATVAWQMDPGLTALVLIVTPVLGGSVVWFGRRLKQRARQNREAQSRLMSFVHQTLGAIPVVQAFSSELRNRHRFQDLSDKAVRTAQRNVLVKNTYTLVNGLTTTIGVASVLYVGGQRVLSGTLSVGSLLVFIAYLRSMQAACQGLLKTYGMLKSAEASIDRVLEVLDAREEVVERADAKPLSRRGPGKGGHVRLEGVSFGYEPGRPVLRDITLEARAGETVALVGATGAGKSTLVSLIPRFFDPWSGRVLLEGEDVRELRLAEVRAQIGLVLQEPFLLPLTVAENIAYGRPKADRETIVAAAQAANADGFIQCLPQGYDTVLGERGVTLSGGEKQRLSIARALLKDAPVLILDEPTSALDAETEASVIEAIERLMRGRTTFIIAHRLSTIRRADRIVVLEHGRVVESGTHQELLVVGGLYGRFHMLQAGADQDRIVA